MRKKLLTALAFFFALSLFLYMTRNTIVVAFFQRITQGIYHAPKATLYEMGVGKEENTQLSQLKKENTKLIEQMVEYERIKNDNKALQDQFQEEVIDSQKLLPARIVGFQGPISSPKSIIIDKGTLDHVAKGMPVVVGKSLIGVVNTPTATYSSVNLVNNTFFSTVAKTTDNKALGVVKGNNGAIIFERVAITDTLSKNDIVLTKGDVGENGKIPPDLIIGKIESINKIASDPFQTAIISSYIDISRLTRVFVITQ